MADMSPLEELITAHTETLKDHGVSLIRMAGNQTETTEILQEMAELMNELANRVVALETVVGHHLVLGGLADDAPESD